MQRALAIFVLIASVGACGRDTPPSVSRKAVDEASARPIEPSTGDWPWWRGPDRNAVAPSATPPRQWGKSRNVVWKKTLSGEGHASPIVWGDRVFLVAANREKQKQYLLCFDRGDGERLWKRTIHEGTFVDVHSRNSQASPTPAADGRRVYTLFAIDEALYATAVDMQGEIVWQTKVGPYVSQHGYGSSPVLYKSAILINGDHHDGGYVAAVSRKTGELLWRTPREKSSSDANYCTPNVARVAGRPQLVLHGYDQVVSYDPNNGGVLWRVDGPAHVCANTPVMGKKHVYAAGGYPRKRTLCTAADPEKDVEKRVRWKDQKGVPYVPTPVLYEGRLYVVSGSGIFTAYEATTGEVLYRERLDGRFWSSPSVANGAIYIPAERGTTHVLEAGKTFQPLAKNTLPGRQMAMPAYSGDRVYLRTTEALYCFAAKGPPAGGASEDGAPTGESDGTGASDRAGQNRTRPQDKGDRK